MDAHFDEISTRLFSPRVWRGIGVPTNMNPLGSSYQSPSGNPAFGFFDDFLSFWPTTLQGPYLHLHTSDDSGITIAQVADTATVKGICALTMDTGTNEDEAILQWGCGLGAPFKLADKDLAFESCFALSAITASKWSIGVGLGEVGMGATDCLFVDSTGALADKNFLGFVKLYAEAGVFDGAYKADGATYQDGATKTKLNALGTFTASATTYHKLGFRYRAHPKTVEWYFDGAALSTIAPARLTATEIDAATFPDDVLMAPIIGVKGTTAAAIVLNLDWWACAQLE
jgi:hypothetical protein